MNEKAVRNPLSEQVYKYILRRVRQGVITPGERINIEAIAKEFGTSRTPVREAIGMLSQAGFVEQRHLSGPRVVDFNVKTAIDLVEYYNILFSNVLSYIRPSDHEVLLTHLEKTLSSHRRAYEDHDDETCFEQSIQFHVNIISFCSNTYLKNAALLAQRQLEICESRYQQKSGMQLKSIEDHALILDFLRRSDWDGFVQAITEHNETALHFFQQLDLAS